MALVCTLVLFLIFLWLLLRGCEKESIKDKVEDKIEDGNTQLDNAYEILTGHINQEESYDIGFGMGPGLYGSGRGNFEMVIH